MNLIGSMAILFASSFITLALIHWKKIPIEGTSLAEKYGFLKKLKEIMA
jgi:hypothetical protein